MSFPASATCVMVPPRGPAAPAPLGDGDEGVERSLFGGHMRIRLPWRFEDISHVRPIPDTQEVFCDAASDQSLIVEILEMHLAEAGPAAAKVDAAAEKSAPAPAGPTFVPPIPSLPSSGSADEHAMEDVEEGEAEWGARPTEVESAAAATAAVGGPRCPHAAELHFRLLAKDNSAVSATLVSSFPPQPFLASSDQHRHIEITQYVCWGTQQVSKYNERAVNHLSIFVCVLRIPALRTDIVLSLNSPHYIAHGSSSLDAIDRPHAAAHSDHTRASADFQAWLATFTIDDLSLIVDEGQPHS